MKSLVFRCLLFLGIAFLMVPTFVRVKKMRVGGFLLNKVLEANHTETFPELIDEQDLMKVFSKPFTYLSRGTQFYAFESYDRKYVLKILRSDRLSIPLRKKVLSKEKISKLNEKKMRKLEALFQACQIAYNILPEETAVIYLHFQPTKNIPKILFVDRLGWKNKMDINCKCFLVQKKALLMKEALLEAKSKNDMSLGKRRIQAFFQLIQSRINKQVSNSDPNLFENFGFSEDRAVEIDFGNFFINPNLKNNHFTYQHEIDRHALVLKAWLLKNWPEMVSFFEEQRRQCLKL